MNVRALIASVALAIAVLSTAGVADAQGEVTGPTVTLGYYEVQPGDLVVVSIEGFDARNVTVATCGNSARRGSSDCNMRQSTGVTLFNGARTLEVVIPAPPTSCPCIVRVNDPSNREVAVIPLTLIGHPIGPVEGAPAAERLAVSVSASVAPDGLWDGLRTSMGGRTTYDVEIRVSNGSPEAVEDVTLAGTVARNGNIVANLDLADPGTLAPGQVYEATVRTDVPRPVIGDLEWLVAARTPGSPTVAGQTESSNVPWLLWVLLGILVIDIVLLVIRLAFKIVRRRRNTASADDEAPLDDEMPPGLDIVTADTTVLEQQPQLVG